MHPALPGTPMTSADKVDDKPGPVKSKTDLLSSI